MRSKSIARGSYFPLFLLMVVIAFGVFAVDKLGINFDIRSKATTSTTYSNDIIVSRTDVGVIMDRRNATNGYVYGNGFDVQSINAYGLTMQRVSGTEGEFYGYQGGYFSPGDLWGIQMRIKSTLPLGTYTGSWRLKYYTDAVYREWKDGPIINYTIQLWDCASVNNACMPKNGGCCSGLVSKPALNCPSGYKCITATTTTTTAPSPGTTTTTAPSPQTTMTTAPSPSRSPTVSCIHSVPTITIDSPNKSGNRGQGVGYTFSITNKDTTACGAATYALSIENMPSGWFTQIPTSITLSPQTSTSSWFNVTSPSNAVANQYSGFLKTTGSYSVHTTQTPFSYTVIP